MLQVLLKHTHAEVEKIGHTHGRAHERSLKHKNQIAKSSKAVKCADCISSEGHDTPSEIVLHIILKYLMLSFL